MTDLTPAKQLTKTDVEAIMAATAAKIALKSHSDEVGAHLTQFVHILENAPVQQQLNCCQSTAVAYALSALGFPTAVDDIFWMLQVPIEGAVGSGMTLAETFDLATRYIHHARLPVFVECHHFDTFTGLTPEDFWAACVADTLAGPDQVLALNFHSGIAHGWTEGGGGHFSVLLGTAGSVEPNEPGEVVVADVHPMKYGAYWSAPAPQLFAAMVDKDSCGRSRGLLRFGLTGKALPRPMAAMQKAPALIHWTSPPADHDKFLLKRFIPRPWGSALGVPNMSGMSAVALAANAVHDSKHQLTDMDACMRALRCSYMEHLHEYQSSAHIFAIAERLTSSGIIDKNHALKVTRIALGQTGEELKQALIDAGVARAGVAIILPMDINVAKGGPFVVLGNTEAAKLSHGPKTWAGVASIDPGAAASDPYGVILCSANHVLRDGRLWATSFERLAAATHQGDVNDGFAVVFALELQNDHAKLESVYRLVHESEGGQVDAAELHDAMVALGVPLGLDEAERIAAECNRDGRAPSLSRNELLEVLSTQVGFHGGHEKGSPRHAQVARFMAENGCVANELGFATCHVALETADLARNVAFYNTTLGWPLYHAAHRAHAGARVDTYGSAWAAYGAFGSSVVFHARPVPIGARGHGPWSKAHHCPAPLRKAGAGGLGGSISFQDLPAGFLGCILEPAFYEKQMARLAEKDAALPWLEVTDVQDRFGGGEIDRAVCFKDPDGHPLVFFVSTRRGEGYTARFPVVPFVYSASFRVSPHYRADVALIRRKITKEMLAQLTRDQLEATTAYYRDILGCRLLFAGEGGGRKRLELEWEGHFLCLVSDPEHVSPALREDHPGNSGHNRGGHQGFVPLPHFGPNTTLASFAAMRKRVEDAMAAHHVPEDDLWCLTRTGRAPPFDHVDGYDKLFPRDPDSCLAMFLTDPSGNVYEAKWYLDGGETSPPHGEGTVAGRAVDNGLIEDHVPPAIRDLLGRRAHRSEG